MLNNIIDIIKLRFRKDRELYFSLSRILGFVPHNIDFYKQALLHKSIARRNEKGKLVNNERLEFLGDAVLDAVVGDIVYRHFPGKREGFLTNTRSKLVQRDMLNKLADEMGITRLVLSSGHNMSHNSYMGGNAFEALVGAIYLDKGYDACMRFMNKRILAHLVNIDKVAYKEVNFKSRLIEWTQKNKVQMQFKMLEQKRDENGNPVFKYMAVIENVECCSASGYSKKESQQMASKLTMERLRREPQLIKKIMAAMKAADNGGFEEEVYPPLIADSRKNGNEHIAGSKKEQHSEKKQKQKDAGSEATSNSEFDLSDISAKAKSREEIIAEAEAAAYTEK